jgi:hypothetical protein
MSRDPYRISQVDVSIGMYGADVRDGGQIDPELAQKVDDRAAGADRVA